MNTVHIDLGSRSYDIHIGEGLMERAGEIIAGVCKGRVAGIVTNPVISRLYGPSLLESLSAAGIAGHMITVPAGERYKTLRTVQRIYEAMVDMKLDRGGALIGLGGGVVGDMAGFAAATYYRGIDFVQIPTSLLAQVDSSVGGKTGVNLPRGKNLVGAFHQPRAVVVDLRVLRSLPARELRAGLAEVIKHGIIRDEDYFRRVEQELPALLRLDPSVLEYIIARSCQIKAEVVRLDERESGLRRVLNYGHTVGHAVERLTSYRVYKHGEAVAIGMVAAALVAREIGSADPALADRIVSLLKRSGLPVKPCDAVRQADVVSAMGLDKKVSHGKLHAVLVDSIGSAYVKDDIPLDAWRRALEAQAGLE